MIGKRTVVHNQICNICRNEFENPVITQSLTDCSCTHSEKLGIDFTNLTNICTVEYYWFKVLCLPQSQHMIQALPMTGLGLNDRFRIECSLI